MQRDYVGAMLGLGPRHYWPCTGGSEVVVADVVGGSALSIAGGLAPASARGPLAGRPAAALGITSSGGYAEGAAPAGGALNAHSVVAWMRHDTAAVNGGYYLGIRFGGQNYLGFRGTSGDRRRSSYVLRIAGAQRSILGTAIESGSTLGVWHLLAGVWDGITMTTWLDGQVDGSLTPPAGVLEGLGPLRLGYGDAGFSLVGGVQHAALFARGLGGEEIRHLYQTGRCLPRRVD